jgi:UDP-N-acetyl-D-glucosamine dehydrogenase
LPLAVKAAESGHKVTGFDIDSSLISRLKLGITDLSDISQNKLLSLQSEGKLEFKANLDDLNQKKIFIIAVPTPLDSSHQPDLSMLEKACLTISELVDDEDLIITESTSYIGTLRDFISKIVTSKSGKAGLKFAVAPERIDPGNKEWNLNNTPRFVAGLTAEATAQATEFYRSFCNSVHSASSPEVVEAAKLLENTFRHVNIALVNELTNLAHKFNFSMNDAISIASTKPFGFMAFYPSIGVGGHCIPVDPSYLSFSASSVGLNLKFVELANSINLSTPSKIVTLIEGKLNDKIKGKTIQLAGIAYKPNVSDLRESPALNLMNELRSKGATVSWYDPLIGNFGTEYSSPLNPKIDLGLIITPHDAIDFTIWKKSKTKVLDLSANSSDYGWPKFL